MKKWNRKKGSEGERAAAEFLKKKGYEIVERNWGNKYGEIDLVMEKDEELVFIEVKMKVGERFGTPEEMVNERKLRQVRRIAEMYLTKKGQWGRYKGFRIDVVCIVKKRGEYEVRHYEAVE